MRRASIAFYPPLAPGAYLRRAGGPLPYPLGHQDCVLFSRGRHAIWQAAHALGIGTGDAVLAPAWHHGAEIEALSRIGARVVFYEPGEALAPDPDELERLVDEHTRALFLTHYLGFPQDGSFWRAWCDERRLLLLEDAAHASLARHNGQPAGSHGHAAMWCLFKSYPLPDGAALRLEGTAPRSERRAALGLSELARGHAHWLLQHAHDVAALVGGGADDDGEFDLAAEIALGCPSAAPLGATAFLLPRVADPSAAQRRRANYALLLDELREQVPEPFGVLPAGAVPLGLPIACADKRATMDRLNERGVEGVDFWCEPHPLLPGDGFGPSNRRRDSTVLLPVHQELRPPELERIAAAARRPRRFRRDSELRIQMHDSIPGLYEEWSQLALASRNVFATPEWASVWCAHFLHDRPPQLIALRDSAGRCVAILPLYTLIERPLRVLRVVGNGPGEDLGPVCDPEDRARVARALPRVLAELGAHALLADHVRAGWSALTGARVLRTEDSPVARFEGTDWEGFMRGRSRRLRKELRRHERQLQDRHGLDCRLGGGDPEQLPAELSTFVSLHRARWADEPSRFLRHLAFHRDFALLACERGWLRLWTLIADGRAVSAAYGFRYAGVEFDYQGGRDPDWRGPAAGTVLQGRQMRAAVEDGVSEYRLGRGGAWYKRRFATHDSGLETLMLSRGAAASAVAAAGAALPDSLSGLVKRRLAA
jgi:dTDP-4-amino-4,6-dideoxygalactose transaminase